jgi:hypothetical protein
MKADDTSPPQQEPENGPEQVQSSIVDGAGRRPSGPDPVLRSIQEKLDAVAVNKPVAIATSELPNLQGRLAVFIQRVAAVVKRPVRMKCQVGLRR